MKLKPRKSLNKSFLKIKLHRIEFDNFKKELNILLNKINEDEREDHNKNFVRDFLREIFYKNNFVNSKGTTDLAIHLGDKSESNVGVIIEVKRPSKTSEMITCENLNAKAMQEVILYYLRERIEEKNDDIKNIIITNAFEWFIFDAQIFEKLFYKNTKLVKDYQAWKNDQKVSGNTEHFYNEIAKKYLENIEQNIEFTYFNLRDYRKAIDNKKDEKNLIPLLKIFSPQHLLKETFANDSNSLDKQFYLELLHIIGLEEKKDGSKKVIRRLDENDRNNGSLLENTLQMLETKDSLRNFKDVSNFGIDKSEQLFNIALELNILWINRILFLKLLEAQLVNYNKGKKDYKFLNPVDIQEYDDLFELFHQVLAQKKEDRKNIKEKFINIPYLNSSLFEISDLERKTFGVDSLKDRFKLPIYKQSVFKKNIKSVQKEIPTLEYLFNFLEAYDFSSEVGEDIAEEKKSIINASVLGLIFEKLNGYKEGSYFTPGFITMYMAKETIRRAIIQKFEDVKGWKCQNLDELRDKIEYNDKYARAEANEIINSLKICDPAVGSGHFLVSSLNEILAIKSELQILSYTNGNRIKDYKLTVENDELNIIDEDEILFKYHLNEKGNTIEGLQKLQEAIFHEKEILIENSLFGVDINPNSVNICRLRLWIELLKNAYYTQDSGFNELETLPNIDINIKQGNSLISRFDLDSDISKALPTVKWKIEDYKNLVNDYKKTNDKKLKRSIQNLISDIKSKITDQLDSNHPLNTRLKRLRKQFHDRFDTIDAFESDLTAKQKSELDKKKKKLEKDLEKAAADIIEFQEGEIYKQAFEWRFEFPEVLDEKGNYLGFDIVIGNPPYISNWDLSESNRNIVLYLEQKFSKYLKGHWDAFNCFIPRGISLLKKNYLISYIVPTSIFKEKHSTNTRKYFIEDMQIIELIDFGTENIFIDVARQTGIFIIKNNRIKSNEFIFKKNIEETPKKIKQDFFKNLKNYALKDDVSSIDIDIFDKLNRNSKLLGNYVCINTGVVAHSKKGSKLSFKKNDVIHKNNPGGFKKYIVGSNMAQYKISFENDYIDYDSKKEFFHRPKYEKLFESPKIIVRRISGENNKYIASFDDKGFYTNDNCMHIVLWNDEILKYQKPENKWEIIKNWNISLKFILSMLNSKFNTYYFSKFLSTNTLQGSYSSIYPEDIRSIPIPNFINTHIHDRLVFLVDELLSIKMSLQIKDTSKLESEIDQLVYKLYGLTEEEIKIVEESVK